MITVTDAAKEKIIKIAKKLQIEEPVLRLRVRSGGCSGLNISVDMIEVPTSTDRLFIFEGFVIAIEKKSYLFLNGMQLDYERTLVRSGFKYNISGGRSCSCGDSFTL